MPEIPFAFQWSIDENRLLSLKDSVNGYLCSTDVTNIPEFEYYLGIYPNGNNNDHRGETWIFLYLKFRNVKNVEADYIVTIESANYTKRSHDIYEKPVGWGPYICETKEFFDSEKKYMVDGKFTVKVNGIFKFQIGDAVPTVLTNQQNWDGGELGDELWKKEGTKDFAIVASDGKQIKVHKFILQNRSEFFTTMLNACSKDSSVEMNDFSFDVVETAVKLMYHCSINALLSLHELMSLQQFLDKYDLPALKAKTEPILIAQISTATVIRLINCSILTNSDQLKRRCMEFLMDSFASKTPLADIKILNKNIAAQILQDNLTQAVVGRVDTPENEQQWKGGELGDELWKKNDTKDITIVVGGKEIKAHKFILANRSDAFNAAENKLVIDDYPFNVVQTAIKMIYICNLTSKLSLLDLMSLLQFFNEYNLPTLKAKVEPYLIAQISHSTVVRLTNASISTNASNLKGKCIEFLIACFAAKSTLNDIQILDKSVALQILENSLYNIVETEN